MNRTLYDRALRALGRRAHSREELRRKLAHLDRPPAVEEVLQHLEDRGYLNDGEYALERARSRRRLKHWGNLRIAHDLKRVGLGARMIELALRRLDEESAEEECLREVAATWMKVRGTPRNASDLKKLYDHCLRMGYPAGMVRAELSGCFRQIEW
ncbi:MAG: regulatory protein RecX [Acidobacteriota bacterium]